MKKLILSLLVLSSTSFAFDYETINEKIIKPKCLSCHNSDYAAAGYNFSTYDGLMETVNPYYPESSLLMDVIKGVKSGVTPMPIGGRRLTRVEIRDIRFWIEDGAHED